jgi:hypothetical protein
MLQVYKSYKEWWIENCSDARYPGTVFSSGEAKFSYYWDSLENYQIFEILIKWSDILSKRVG